MTSLTVALPTEQYGPTDGPRATSGPVSLKVMPAKLFVNLLLVIKSKAVPLHAMEALGVREDIAPTHSRPRY
jgi:hypothetical protein